MSAEIERIERALLEEPSIDACVVLDRENSRAARERIAYVVSSTPVSGTQLDSRLADRIAGAMRPCVYVPISSIPLTPNGQVDEQMLRSLPVVDEDVARGCQERVAALAGVDRVSVLVEERCERRPMVHLDTLLPDWRRVAAGPETGAHGADLRHRSKGGNGSRVPAVSHGNGLRCADELPANLAESLSRAAHSAADNGLVYVTGDAGAETQTYPELLERAERVLAGLRDRGLRPGDKVIFQLERNQDFIEAFWGCTLGGFVPVPVSIAPSYSQPNSTISKLHNAWELLGRPIVLTDEKLAESFRTIHEVVPMDDLVVESINRLRRYPRDTGWHSTQADDVAIFLLTSGSTGKPKAVMQTHRSLLHRSAGSAQLNGFSGRDVSLNWFPLDHVGGIVMFHLRDVYLCCRQIHAQTEDILRDPLKWLDLIEHYRATITWAPNFAFGLVADRSEEIAERSWDLSSMRFILNGGEAIVAKTARRFLSLLQPHGLPPTSMHPAWGMSETSSGVAYSRDFSLDSTSDEDPFVEVGSPIPRVSMRIVDSKNKILREGETGLLQISGATVTCGYYDNPRLNLESFTRDGWFKTGDLGFLRNGRLTITGREKDVVIINGVNYYSHEIEAAVEEIAGVETSFTAACAVHDHGSGKDKLAIFFNPSNPDRRMLRDLLQEIRGTVARSIGITPDYLVPVSASDIPKTSIGKIQRSQLVERFESGGFGSACRETDILLENANTLPSWFYRKIWRPKESAGAGSNREGGAVLIFNDALGLGSDVRERLAQGDCACVVIETGTDFRKLGADRYLIRPEDSADYDRLLESLALDRISPDRVLHLWTYAEPCGDAQSRAELVARVAARTHSLLHLVRALARWNGDSRPMRMHVIGSLTQPTGADDDFEYYNAPVTAIVKTIAQELPWMSCRHVDLSLADGAANAAHVLRELSILEDEREVAYRGGVRLVSRLQEIDWTRATPAPLPLRQGGVYVLSGGLGGIAEEIARHLLVNYQARLVLVGRSDPATPADTSCARAERHATRMQALAKLPGEVAYEAADVADLDALQAIAARTRARWGSGIDGVFHLAGAYDENLLGDEDTESFDGVLHAKVAGTWALQRMLCDEPGAFLVGFSSATSYFGGATVGSYSAANVFLEHFTRYHDRRGGPRCLSLAWTAWRGLGVSRDFEMKHLLDAHGYLTMAPEQALHSLLAALHLGEGALLIGLDGANRHVRRHLEAPTYVLRRPVAYFSTSGAHTLADLSSGVVVADRFGTVSGCECRPVAHMPLDGNGEVDRDALRALSSDDGARGTRGSEPRDEGERAIADLWREVLSVSRVGIEDNFFELGGDSLLAVQLLARIRDELHAELSVRSLFEAATLADLAEVVAASRSREPASETFERTLTPGEQLAAIDRLSEDEIDALLSRMKDEEKQLDGN